MNPNRRRLAALVVLAALLAWSIYASGSPDREVARLISANPSAFSNDQLAARFMQRIPPGTTQQAAVDYLLKHGLDRDQILTLYPEQPGSYLMIRIRNRGYIPNPIIRSNEYTILIFIGQDRNVSRIEVNRGWDHFGYTSGD